MNHLGLQDRAVGEVQKPPAKCEIAQMYTQASSKRLGL